MNSKQVARCILGRLETIHPPHQCTCDYVYIYIVTIKYIDWHYSLLIFHKVVDAAEKENVLAYTCDISGKSKSVRKRFFQANARVGIFSMNRGFARGCIEAHVRILDSGMERGIGGYILNNTALYSEEITK